MIVMPKPKRLTDSGKWEDEWFSGLDPDMKLVWLYVLDSLDHAGTCKRNFKLLRYCTGTVRDELEIRNILGNRVIEFDSDRWFVPKFLKFQYPAGIGNPSPLFNSIREILENFNLLDTVTIQLGRGFLTPKDKDKDKDKKKEVVNEVIEVKEVIEETLSTTTEPKISKKNTETGIEKPEMRERCISNLPFTEPPGFEKLLPTEMPQDRVTTPAMVLSFQNKAVSPIQATGIVREAIRQVQETTKYNFQKLDQGSQLIGAMILDGRIGIQTPEDFHRFFLNMEFYIKYTRLAGIQMQRLDNWCGDQRFNEDWQAQYEQLLNTKTQAGNGAINGKSQDQFEYEQQQKRLADAIAANPGGLGPGNESPDSGKSEGKRRTFIKR